MLHQHQSKAIEVIMNATYPEEGTIVVEMGAEGYPGLFIADQAIQIIVNTPKVEFKPQYFWKLN
jgi:hypothetical protein